jgi:tetratricopeptide (TPR) repeat protein
MDPPVPVPGVDPSRVNTPAELAACLNGLRLRCGLSYEAMEKAARNLRSRSGGLRWEPLSRSTVGEIVNGKRPRPPAKGKVLTFLAVCEVASADRAQWLAAWERACTADLSVPAGAVRIRDARPRLLGVHAAIEVEGAVGDLPVYVRRDLDAGLRAALTIGATQGCFVLLVGGSSVGKTRTLYEAVLATMPDWWLIHPDRDDRQQIRALAAAPTPRTVLWLDELQRYLHNPDRVTAGIVRAMLRGRTVLVGTMWPDDYAIRVAARQTGTDDRYARDRELLDLAHVFDVADVFTAAEHTGAQELAATDGRIRVALDSSDGGLTQVLAAGPELVRRWEQADPYAKAIITAAVDARRLGVDNPVTVQFLADAAPRYPTTAQRATAPIGWLQHALAFATTLLHGATSALVPVDDGTMGGAAGYVAADYLLQHARRTRRTDRLPASAWQALVAHIGNPDDVKRLAGSAQRRMRYRYALLFHQRLIDGGDREAAWNLARMLADCDRIDDLRARADAGEVAALVTLADVARRRGRIAEAIDLLTAAANMGDGFAAMKRAELLAEQGSIDELEALVEAHDAFAGGELPALHDRLRYDPVDSPPDFERRPQWDPSDLRDRIIAGEAWAIKQLADQLVEADRVDEAIQLLRAHAKNQDFLAGRQLLLADLLAEQGHIDEAAECLQVPANAQDYRLVVRRAELAAQLGRVDDAISVLQSYADAPAWREDGQPLHRVLIDLLAEHRLSDKLRMRADAEDWRAAQRLAFLLAEQQDASQLEAEVEAGTHDAAQRLIALLASQGAIEKAQAMRTHGLKADGTIDDW